MIFWCYLLNFGRIWCDGETAFGVSSIIKSQWNNKHDKTSNRCYLCSMPLPSTFLFLPLPLFTESSVLFYIINVRRYFEWNTITGDAKTIFLLYIRISPSNYLLFLCFADDRVDIRLDGNKQSQIRCLTRFTMENRKFAQFNSNSQDQAQT